MIRLCLALIALASPAFADADGPDAWQVTGVAANDVLNLRAGPGTEYPIKGALPPNARKVKADICVPTLTDGEYFALSEKDKDAIAGLQRWCHVTGAEGQRGWANMRYMAEDP